MPLNNWSRNEKIGVYTLIVAIGTFVAAVVVVPEFRNIMRLNSQSALPNDESSSTPSYDTPFSDSSQTDKIVEYKLDIKFERETDEIDKSLSRLEVVRRLRKFREAYGREPSEREVDKILEAVVK